MTKDITVDMVIGDVISNHPQTAQVFIKYGLPCAACAVRARESIAGGAHLHSIGAEARDLLIQDLNAALVAGARPSAAAQAFVEENIPPPASSNGTKGNIKYSIAIMSGKGGVGKSVVTGLLATSLRRQGFSVGILDGDITGSSMAHLFGAQGQLSLADDGKIVPLESAAGVRIISMNMFLENESDAVVWGGPMISSAHRQFYNDVEWGELDYLLVDSPSGTSDGAISILQSLPLDGVVVVSSPEALAMPVVEKGIAMVRQLKTDIIGIVENMSYLEQVGDEAQGSGAGALLVALTGAPLLVQLPADRRVAALCNTGRIEEFRSEDCVTLVANFINALKIKGALPI